MGLEFFVAYVRFLREKRGENPYGCYFVFEEGCILLISDSWMISQPETTPIAMPYRGR